MCEVCEDLFGYAMARLDHCIYGPEKPTCRNCPVHCYKKEMRAAMREVMIYSGPRMLQTHPVLAVRHLLNGRKPPPPHPLHRATQ